MEVLGERDYLCIYFKVAFNDKDTFKKECRGIWSPNIKQWYIKIDISDMGNDMKYEDIVDYIKELINCRLDIFKYNYSHCSFNKGFTFERKKTIIKIVDELFRTHKTEALKQIELKRIEDERNDVVYDY